VNVRELSQLNNESDKDLNKLFGQLNSKLEVLSIKNCCIVILVAILIKIYGIIFSGYKFTVYDVFKFILFAPTYLFSLNSQIFFNANITLKVAISTSCWLVFAYFIYLILYKRQQ